MNLGTYQLLVHEGPGCPGDWYKACDADSDRQSRILVCWDESTDSAGWQAVAHRLQILAQISHPAVIPVNCLCLQHQPPFAVLAKPVGVSLADQIEHVGMWPEQEVLEIGRRLSSALVAAHRLGLTHGCLTPSAIWMDESEGAALDFARPVHTTNLDDESVAAMRSEFAEAAGSIFNAAVDIRALGHVLHQLIYGALPRKNPAPSKRKIGSVQALPDLLELMTAREPDERPSAEEVLHCVQRLMGDSDHHRFVDVTGVEEDQLGKTWIEVSDDNSIPGFPKQLGRYQLIKKLGEGGLGVVYLAEDSADGSLVAVKTLHPHLTNNEATVRRFRKEARLLAEVKSANVCQILDFNEDQSVHYLVMEFLQGESLGSLLTKYKKLPEPVALALMADVARALGEAHSRGIVHRDVKPDNIMLVGPWPEILEKLDDKSFLEPSIAATNLGVKLCDFGLARHVDQSESLNLTHTHQAVGTPLYMSPEQASQGEITPRSDVYSLGVTLFHVLAGRPPFQANSILALYEMHAKADAPSPQVYNNDLGPALCQVVKKALAKDPQSRYADANELLIDLERILRGEPTSLVVHPRMPVFEPGELLEYNWTLELESSPDQLWPLVSNTERLNHAIGLPAVQYTLELLPSAAGSTLPARTERTGTIRKAGLTNTWREHAFEWIEGKRMGVLREFRQGVFKWMVSIVELQARADGGATLQHRIRLVPRGIFGRLVAALEIGYKARHALEKVYRRMDAYLARKLPQSPATDPFQAKPANPVNDKKVAHRLVEQLSARGVAFTVAEDLVDFFLKAPEQEIARIRPIALADGLRLNPDEVIDACLAGAFEGILVILWDILCPKCRIPSAIEETMRNIRSHGRCEACNLDFELDFTNSVEMIFRVHPNLRSSEQGVYCVGGPAHSPHVAAQVRVAPAERLELTMNLGEGSYRLRGPQLPYSVDFRIHPEAKAACGELVLAAGPTLDFPRTFRTGAQSFFLNNDHSSELIVRVERTAGRRDALTASQVSGLARFREFFPQEVLSGNQLVSVAHVTLLATDLVGASELYQKLGDARTFGLVHEHFRILEDHIRKESGALLKTHNEGILATFEDPAAAVRVALNLQNLLAGNPTTMELSIRVGVHRGSAMVATINGKLDYFGSAIKLAQRLPSLVAGKEIVVSQPLVSDLQVQNLLAHRGLSCVVLDDESDLPLHRLVPIARTETARKPSGSSAGNLKQFEITPVG